jgi:hypothetical protein
VLNPRIVGSGSEANGMARSAAANSE